MRLRLPLCLAVVLPGVCLASVVEARPFRRAQVPFGLSFGCQTCHVDPGGGGTRNDFGMDVEANLSGFDADWPAVFALDSDGDGFTNGAELGDPMGLWRTGSPDPMVTPSQPWNAASVPPPPMDGGTPDMGGSPDMGVPVDMGPPPDMGVMPPLDTGARPDAGTPPDTGVTRADAGPPPFDDGGSPGRDASTPSADDDEDDGGCRASGRAVAPWLVAFGFFLQLRRRRLTHSE